jgi:hypothetical protein
MGTLCFEELSSMKFGRLSLLVGVFFDSSILGVSAGGFESALIALGP